MSHHGWVSPIDVDTITPDALLSPFGRLMAAKHHVYSSHAIALLTGGFGPMQDSRQDAIIKAYNHDAQTAAAETGATHVPKPHPAAGKTGNPAGFTFLGQFIDHDMTEFRMIGPALNVLDANPNIGQRQTVLEDLGVSGARLPTTTNGRTGKLDLDAVYGLLGGAQPDLFDKNGLFHIEPGPDIKRGGAYRNKRLIADPRNDENKLVVQVHLLFERLHNKVHAAKTGPGPRAATSQAFLETREAVTRAYHRIVLHDYLPRIVHKQQIDLVLEHLKKGDTLYQKMNRRNKEALVKIGIPAAEADKTIAMPVEFAHAAFRLGHSQLRNKYKLRSDAKVSEVPLFDTSNGELDLRGDKELAADPGFHVEWKYFFKTDPAVAPQHGMPIDGGLPDAIFRLPPPTIKEPPISLAERNIRRGVDFGMPSGQDAASALAEVYGFVPALSLEEIFPPQIYGRIAEVVETAPELQWATPLWYYILMEAGISGDGLDNGERSPQLGVVGGLIVAETLLGSLVESKSHTVQKIIEAYQDHPPQSVFQENDKFPEDGDKALRWDKAVASVNDIHTMSQLIRFVEAK